MNDDRQSIKSAFIMHGEFPEKEQPRDPNVFEKRIAEIGDKKISQAMQSFVALLVKQTSLFKEQRSVFDKYNECMSQSAFDNTEWAFKRFRHNIDTGFIVLDNLLEAFEKSCTMSMHSSVGVYKINKMKPLIYKIREDQQNFVTAMDYVQLELTKWMPKLEKRLLLDKVLERGASYIGRNVHDFLPARLEPYGETFVLIYYQGNSHAEQLLKTFWQLLEVQKRCIFVDAICSAENYFCKNGPQMLLFEGHKHITYKLEVDKKINESLKLRALNTCTVLIASKQFRQTIKNYKSTWQSIPALRYFYVFPEKQKEVTKINNEVKWTPPVNAIQLELPCPLAFRNKCPMEDYYWDCTHCGETLHCFKNKTGAEITHFICGCGVHPVDEFRFRCKNVGLHDTQYVAFKPKNMRPSLKRFAEFSHYNILLLGCSGVGKSTFINGFANYITYDTLDDAFQNPLCPIPSRFTTFDNNGELKEIRVGDENDKFAVHEWGKTCTQFTKAYTFPYKGGRVRLIDPPGIGDPRGHEKDRENIRNIISYVSELQELHAICILLKPNEARLEILLEYCINELLSHMHCNAVKKILFCFTNVGSTSGKPGQSYITLETLLKACEAKSSIHINLNMKTNVYCTENGSFRFLWEVKKGIEKTPLERDDARRHWENSSREVHRMLDHVTKINDDSRPLAEIMQKMLEEKRQYRQICYSPTRNLKEKNDNGTDFNGTDGPESRGIGCNQKDDGFSSIGGGADDVKEEEEGNNNDRFVWSWQCLLVVVAALVYGYMYVWLLL